METFVSMFTGMTVFVVEDCWVDQQRRSRERLRLREEQTVFDYIITT